MNNHLDGEGDHSSESEKILDRSSNQFKRNRIGWFPGHMKKTTKLIEKNLKGCDLIVEVLDARVPSSSRSGLVASFTQSHPRLFVLNKADLADPEITEAWVKHFNDEKAVDGVCGVLEVDSKASSAKSKFKELLHLVKQIVSQHSNRNIKKNMSFKVMITGVPNVGKSSYINYLCGRKKVKVENRPGVTRGQQFIRLNDTANPNSLEEILLIDLPGVLDHKLEETQGYRLALLGFIKDELVDFSDVGLWLCDWMLTRRRKNRDFLKNIPVLDTVFKNLLAEDVADESVSALDLFKKIAEKKGCIKREEFDFDRTGFALTKEIRSGKWGRFSLELPN